MDHYGYGTRQKKPKRMISKGKNSLNHLPDIKGPARHSSSSRPLPRLRENRSTDSINEESLNINLDVPKLIHTDRSLENSSQGETGSMLPPISIKQRSERSGLTHPHIRKAILAING